MISPSKNVVKLSRQGRSVREGRGKGRTTRAGALNVHRVVLSQALNSEVA